MPVGMTYNMYDIVTISTRDVYGQVLCEMGEKHSDIVGLSADLANSTKIVDFKNKFPDRFFNAGIAEQNMFGVAAGLAKAGYTPYVSTFAAFAAMRSCEQIRTDICYQNLNVKIISTHGGTSFGTAGSTHHCTEDLGIMRTFPNMCIVVPVDGYETANVIEQSYSYNGPMYVRLNRSDKAFVYENKDYGFEIGKAVIMNEGTDLTIIACGTPLQNAIEAVRQLEKEDGLKVRLINMHTIKPLDNAAVLSALEECGKIITLEDHNTIGGLGDAVASVVAGSGKACKFQKVGIPDEFSMLGMPDDILAHYKMDSAGIVKVAREFLSK